MLQPLNSCEGYFSLPLACKLLPSTVGRAQQLLAKGRALDALYCLCPGSTSVLLAYAGEKKQARWRYPADLCCAVLCCQSAKKLRHKCLIAGTGVHALKIAALCHSLQV